MAKITRIQCIRTRADGMWTIVKVHTDQPGLYGIGSASDVRHPETVIKAVETIAPLKPLLPTWRPIASREAPRTSRSAPATSARSPPANIRRLIMRFGWSVAAVCRCGAFPAGVARVR